MPRERQRKELIIEDYGALRDILSYDFKSGLTVQLPTVRYSFQKNIPSKVKMF